MRLVDAEYALKLAEDPDYGFESWNGNLNDVKCLLSDCPTVEEKPVVHAHWVTDFDFDPEEEEELFFYFCSKCKNELFGDKEDFKYCPYCGARMDEVASDTNVGSKTQKESVVIGEVPDEEVEELKELFMKEAKCGGAQNG